jgi:signal peptidase I
VTLLVIGMLGTALVGAAGWVRVRFVVVTVEGPSMEPAYHDGDRLLVRRTRSRIHRGAVVVGQRFDGQRFGGQRFGGQRFGGQRFGGQRSGGRRGWIVKRVAAVAGDPVPVPVRTAAGAASVPAGALVLLGENPAHSHDSRAFGFYPVDRLVGVAVRKLSRPAREDRPNRSRWSLETSPR